MVNVDPVIARIELDTKDFYKKLEDLQKKTKELGAAINVDPSKGFQVIIKETEKTEKKVKSLTTRLKELSETLDIGISSTSKDAFSKEERQLDNLINKFEKFTALKEEGIFTKEQIKSGNASLELSFKNLNKGIVSTFANLDNEHDKYLKLGNVIKELQELTKGTTFDGKTSSLEDSLKKLDTLWKEGKLSLESYERALNILNNDYNKLSKSAFESILGLNKQVATFDVLKGKLTELDRLFKSIGDEKQLSGSIRKYESISSELNKVKELMESGKITTKQYQDTLKLLEKEFNTLEKSVLGSIVGLEKQGVTFESLKQRLMEVKKLFSTGYDEKQFVDANRKYESMAVALNRIKGLMDISRLTTDQYTGSLKLLERELNNLEKSMLKDITGLGNQETAFNRLKKSIDEVLRLPLSRLQNVDEFSRLKEQLLLVNEQYQKGELTATQYREALKLLETEVNRLNGEITRSALGFPQFNNGIRKTEESVAGLRKRLWDLRGVYLSLKTMFTMFGSLAVWDFGFKLAENVRKTFQAQSEFVSQLTANSKIRSYEIEYLNRALDETAQRFQKINKYQLGETVSSIGLEFNLSAQEMKKALPVVTMVTNEYLRAGRTQEEAALAIKDILQGEIRRLSMETGVGKEELAAHGWKEDSKDIMTLFKALEEIGEARHWDTFAEKANSMNDILTITQSRLSEFGASLVHQISPLFVSGFNMILSTIDNFNKGIMNVGEGGKFTFELGGAFVAFRVLGTLLLMSSKNLGLLDIKTIGFTKSLAGLVLRLDQAKIAQYGFRKTLALTITGMDEVNGATLKSRSLILSRILGIDATVVKEKGWLTAMVRNKMALKEGSKVLEANKEVTLSLSQKLLYLAGNIDIATVKSKSFWRALFSLGNILKGLKYLVLGVIGLNFVGWFITVSSVAKETSDKIGRFHKVLSEGSELQSKAQSSVEQYNEKLAQLSDTESKRYKQLSADRDIVKGNVEDLERARKAAKEYNDAIKKQGEANKENKKRKVRESLELAGVDYSIATQMANGWEMAVKSGGEAELKAYEAEQTMYNARIKDMQEMIKYRKSERDESGKQKYTQKELVDYAMEYSDLVSQTAEHWKQFNKGDLKAGAYYLIDRFRLALKDATSDKDFQTFWKGLTGIWKGLIPVAKEVARQIGFLMKIVGDFLGSDFTKGAITWFSHGWMKKTASMGIIAFVMTKLVGKGAGGIKNTIDNLKTVKDGVEAVTNKIKDYRDTVKNIPDLDGSLPGGNKSEKSPKKVELPSPFPEDNLPDKSKIGWWDKAVETFREYGKLLGHLAGVTVIVIAGLGAIAGIGVTYKLAESQIKDGIEAIHETWQTLVALIAPVAGLTIAMEKFELLKNSFTKDNFMKSAGAIAGILILTTEAIIGLGAPLIMISALGAYKNNAGNTIDKGIEVINQTKDTLLSVILPVSALWAGMSVVYATLGGVGSVAVLLGGIVAGVAIAELLFVTTEVIWGLQYPIGQIAALGKQYSKNGEEVKKGAEVIKLTAESLQYIAQALTSMVVINFDQMITNAQKIAGYNIKDALDSLIKDDGTGVFDELSAFAKRFNEKDFEGINSERADALNRSVSSLTSISTGITSLNTALRNLPTLDEESYYVNDSKVTSKGVKAGVTSKGEKAEENTNNKLNRLLEPLANVKDFADKINSERYSFDVSTLSGKAEAITQIANIISQIQTATQSLKTTLQAAGDTEYARASAKGGFVAAFTEAVYAKFGYIKSDSSGTDKAKEAGYTSAIGPALLEMENIINDLIKFNTNLNGKSFNTDSDTVKNFSDFITHVQDLISKVKTTLDGAKGGMEEKGKLLGDYIVKGFEEGLKGGVEKAKNGGRNMGTVFADGFKFKAHVAVSFTNDEINNIIGKINERKDDVREAGRALGSIFAQGYRTGAGIHSPGIAARSTEDEIGYIMQYIQRGMDSVPQMAGELGQMIGQGMSPNLDFAQLQLPDISQMQQQIIGVIPTLDNLKDKFSLDFQQIQQTVGQSLETPQFDLTQLQLPNAQEMKQQMTEITPTIDNLKNKFTVDFQQIQQKVGGAFKNITSITKTQLGTMKTDTILHIQAIKTSWHGLQTALIGSAETIRKQVTTKISAIKSNMGDFWSKITHPDRLIGGYAGNLKSQPRRTGSIRLPPIRYAGGGFGNTNNKDVIELLKCLMHGKNCYAGGWNFNWTPKIESTYGKWGTRFRKYNIDKYTNVGKFKNSKFPIKGNADIAKRYIFDVISRTSYAKYYNSRFGDDPVAALRAGAFNCWDGTNIVLALANAFGFKGERGHTLWGGTRHVYARIPGLGIIDPTSIQQRGTFRARGVRYAGNGGVTNHNTQGNVTVNVQVNGPVYGVDDLESKINGIAESVADRIVSKRNRDLFL